jgi:hypothetical protein
MAQLRYVFGNLRTNEVLDEFSLQGVSMTDKLNGWGTLRGSFGLDQSGKDNIDLVSATIPGQCFICVERIDFEGLTQIVWFGIIWSRSYQSQAKIVNITARSLPAYAEKRRISAIPMNYVNMDQGEIFRELWYRMQGDNGATWPPDNIRVDSPDGFPTGVLKTLNVEADSFKVYLDAMTSLSDAEDGFDWRIDTTKDSLGVYKHTLKNGFPTLGNTDHTLLTFEYPGNITNYYETASISEAGNYVHMIGEKSEGDGGGFYATYADWEQLETGLWCSFEQVISRLDVKDYPTLEKLVNLQGPLRKPPMNVQKVFVRGDADPQFGEYKLGDACRVIITDPLHPTGDTFNLRITQWNYTPTSDEGIDEVELIFEGDELNQE